MDGMQNVILGQSVSTNSNCNISMQGALSTTGVTDKNSYYGRISIMLNFPQCYIGSCYNL